MQYSYQVILRAVDDGAYAVHVPDFDIWTQGFSFDDAKEMAVDAISIWIKDALENSHAIPDPSKEPFAVDIDELLIELVLDID